MSNNKILTLNQIQKILKNRKSGYIKSGTGISYLTIQKMVEYDEDYNCSESSIVNCSNFILGELKREAAILDMDLNEKG